VTVDRVSLGSHLRASRPTMSERPSRRPSPRADKVIGAEAGKHLDALDAAYDRRHQRPLGARSSPQVRAM
jgi:hypothetical protein